MTDSFYCKHQADLLHVLSCFGSRSLVCIKMVVLWANNIYTLVCLRLCLLLHSADYCDIELLELEQVYIYVFNGYFELLPFRLWDVNYALFGCFPATKENLKLCFCGLEHDSYAQQHDHLSLLELPVIYVLIKLTSYGICIPFSITPPLSASFFYF